MAEKGRIEINFYSSVGMWGSFGDHRGDRLSTKPIFELGKYLRTYATKYFHIEIFSILCIQFILCINRHSMK